jgi:ATP-dependent DNA ligase
MSAKRAKSSDSSKKPSISAKIRCTLTPQGQRNQIGSVDLQMPVSESSGIRKGQMGEGLTVEDMKRCRWLKPQLVAMIEFLEWTFDRRLRHPKFVSLRLE